MCLANKYSVRYSLGYSSSFSESNAEESSFQSGVLYWLGGWLPAQRSGGQSSKQFWRWVHCHGCYGFCLLLTVVPRRCTVRLWKGGGHLGMNACVSQFPSPSTYTLALVGWYMLLVTDIHILLIIQTTWMHTIIYHCMHPHIQIHSCCMSSKPNFPRTADEAWDWPKRAPHSGQLYVSCDSMYRTMWPSWEAIFSVGSKFRLILNFTELLTLVLVTCSYALLLSADSILFLQLP